MDPNQNHLSLQILSGVGAILAFGSFALFYVVGQWQTPEWLNNVYLYGQHLGVALLLFGICLNKDKRERELFYYPIAFFYIFVTAAYFLNDVLNIVVQTNVIILPSLILCALCLLLYFTKSR
jgi:hypothetical protein